MIWTIAFCLATWCFSLLHNGCWCMFWLQPGNSCFKITCSADFKNYLIECNWALLIRTSIHDHPRSAITLLPPPSITHNQEVLHNGLVWCVHRNECCFIFTYTFLDFFLSKNLCFYHFYFIFLIKCRISATEY